MTGITEGSGDELLMLALVYIESIGESLPANAGFPSHMTRWKTWSNRANPEKTGHYFLHYHTYEKNGYPPKKHKIDAVAFNTYIYNQRPDLRHLFTHWSPNQ